MIIYCVTIHNDTQQNQDLTEKGVKKTKKIYALYEHEKYIGDYVAKEIAQICGIDNKRVSAYEDSGRLINGMYRLEAVDEVVNWNLPLKREWNQRRRKILKYAKQINPGCKPRK